MFWKEKNKITAGSFEELISMVLGLLIVIVAIGLIFNFVKKQSGNVNVPGVNTNVSLNSEDLKNNANENKTTENTYEVVRGDNLWKIAEKNYGSGYAWVNIAKENKIENPGLISVGQKLVMPVIESKDIAKVGEKEESNLILPSEYSVIKGDNLWQIAVRTYDDGFQWVKIWESNKSILSNPSKIEIGMKLILPKLSG